MSAALDSVTKTSTGTPLAGSRGSTGALGDSDHRERRLGASDDAGGLPAGAGRLLWTCERCNKRVGGVGAGFAAVDLRETDAAARGRLTRTGVDGAAVVVKAPWHVFHAKCAPEVVKPLNPYFRIWIERVRTVHELLDAVAELSRLPWFGWSDWGGLVRRVLADTDRVADEWAALREQRAQRRRRNAREHKRLPPEDERCGSDRGYHAGCGCDACRAAHNEVARRNKAKRKVRS